MNRTVDDWKAINPKYVVADCSPAHIENLIADAIADIAELEAQLAAERERNANNVANADYQIAELRAEISRLREGGCAKGQATTQWCAEAQRLAEDAAILDWLADHEVVQDVDGVNPDIHDIARRISDNQGRQKQSTIKTYRQALRQMIRAAMDEKRNDDSGL